MSGGSLSLNGRTLKTSWAGTWGVLGDGRSKISRKAKAIEALMVKEHKPATPLERRKVHRAAVLEALAEQTIDTMGSDPKSTRRSLTSLSMVSQRLLEQVPKPSTQHEIDPMDALLREP